MSAQPPFTDEERVRLWREYLDDIRRRTEGMTAEELAVYDYFVDLIERPDFPESETVS